MTANNMPVYADYLESVIDRYKLQLQEDQERIALNQAILDIVKKRSDHKLVSQKTYGGLAKYGCPDYYVINAVQKTENNMPDEPFDDNDDYNCADISCATCWKNYIDCAIKTLNISDVIIKRI